MRSTYIKLLFGVLFTMVISRTVFAANEISVTATIGTVGPTTYSSLTGAAGVFSAINAGTHRGVVTITVNGSESAETGANALAASGTGSSSYTSLRIYTSGTYTISGAVSGVLIPLNGADNVTIDGRVSQTGSTVALTFDNTAVAASGNIALKLYGTATSNTITYCTFKAGNSSVTASTAGVINIGGGASCDITNTISYCNVTQSSGQVTQVGISGALSASGANTLNYNNIYDFQQYGIFVYEYAVGWSVTNNSLYQTGSITLTADMIAIDVVNSTSSAVYNNTITGNFIGGQSTSCGGSAFTLSSSAFVFTGIYASGVGTGTNTISSNTIQNFNLTTTRTTAKSFVAIETNGSSTTVNWILGSSGNGNTIGSSSGTGNISITNSAASTSSGGFYGFLISAQGAATIEYNTLASVTFTTTATADGDFYGIYSSTSAATTITINNNTFGNSTAQNLVYSSPGTTTGSFYIIYNNASSRTLSVHHNTIQNISSNCGMSTNYVIILNAQASADVYNNTISNVTSALGSSATTNAIRVNAGATTATFNIYNNTISSISATSNVYCIYTQGTSTSTFNLYNNIITSFSTSATGSTILLYGIFLGTSGGNTSNVYNNIVLTSDASNLVAKVLRGIHNDNGGGTSNIYNNTVSLTAGYTSGGGTTVISAAYSTSATTGTQNIKNNIWQNLISGTTYSLAVKLNSSAPTFTITKNYLEAPLPAGNFCYWNNASVTWAQWQVQTGVSGEVTGTISISSTTGKAAASTTIGSAGTYWATSSPDYEGTTRSNPNCWIGAYETATTTSGYYWVGGIGNWSDYATHWATSSGGATFNASAPTSTDDVYFDGNSGGGTCTIAATANAKSITCTGYTGTWAGSSALNCYGSLLLVSGMTNSYTGTLTMAATSGTNTITSGTKTIANLTINGTGGTFTPSDNTTVSGTFTMTAGTFNVGNGASALTTQVATFSQTGGTFNIAGSSATANQILTVTGNFTLATGGVFDLNAQAGSYSGTLNVAGNFTHSGTTLQATRNSASYDFINLTKTSSSQTLESTGQSNIIVWNVAGSNGQCNIATSKSFYLGATSTFTVANGSSGNDLLIDGTFINQNSAAITMTGVSSVSATGTYIHAVAAGTVPQMTWATASTCKITGATNALPAGITNVGAQTNMFGNFIWDCASQSTSINLASGGSTWTSFVLEGNLTVSNTNSNTLIISGTASNVSRSFTVKGDLTVSGATSKFVMTEYWDVITLNVYGEIIINAGIFYGESATYTNIGTTINAEKGFVVSNSGVFKAQNQTASNTGYLTLNFSNTQGGNNSSTITFGTSLTRYGEARWDINVASGRTITLGSNIEMGTSRTFAVQSGGILVIPAAYIVCINTNSTAATGTVFNLNSGGTLKIANTAGIVLTGSATGAIQTTTRTFSATGNLEYNGTLAQASGTASVAANNLVINNSAGVTLSVASTITGVLTLTSGILTTDATNIIYVNNTSNLAVVGGSTTAYINGPMKWALGTTGLVTFSFPLGKTVGGITYCPFSLASVSGTSPIITAEVFSGDNGGSADAATISSLSTTEYWVVSNTGTYTTGSVSLGRTAIGSATKIGRGTNAGVYYGLNGTVSGNSVITSDLTGSTLGYFRLGGDASGYYWNGASTAANPAAGGTGTWGTALSWRYSTSTGTAGVYGVSGASNAFLAGTAGTITMDASYSPTATYIKTTGYTLATSGGAWTLANPLSLSSYALTLAPTSTGTSTLTLSGVISGSGLLTHNGTGKTILSGTNTNSGGVTLTAGTLYLSNAVALGTGTFTIASGTTIDGGAITISPAVAQTWNGSFNFTGTNSLNLGTGAVTLGASTTITAAHATNTLTIGGIIDDGASTYNLATAGTAGPIILSGANTYGGTTTIGSGSKLKLGAAGVIPDASAVTVTGTLDVVSYSETVGSIAGAGTIDAGSGAGTPTLTFGGDNSNQTFSGLIKNTSGTLSLDKSGSGAITLSTTANTFTGGLTLSAGTLNINNAASIGTGTLTISAGTIDNTSGGAIINSNNNAQAWNGDFAFTGTNNLDLGTGAVTPSATPRTVTVNGGILKIGGIIAGGAKNITKAGTGAITLGGANTFSSGFTLTAGTVNINNAAALGTGTFIITTGTLDNTTGGLITNSNNNAQTWNGDFTFTGSNALDLGTGAVSLGASRQITVTASTLTVGGVIGTGAKSLTKAGAGILTLSGTNTYTSGFILNQGTVNINNTQALGTSAGTFNLSGSGGTIVIDNTTAGAITTVNHPQTWGADFTFTGTQNLNLGTGAVSLSATRTVTTTANTLTVGGVISGATFGITKAGAGTLTLSGAASTYTGATTINSGVLSFSTVANGGSNSGIGAASTAATNLVIGAGTLQYTGATNSTDRAFALVAATTGTIDVTTNTLTISGASGNSTSGALTKIGTGTLVLSGANNYTGLTTVTAGVLNIQNILGTGTTAGGITVANGAALQVQGVVIGAETLSLTGTGVAADGALRAISGTSGYGGAITLASASRINTDAGTLTLTGGVTATNIDLSIGGAGNTTISTAGITTGTGTLTKDGAGTLTLNFASTYTGTTTISAGTLTLGIANVISNSSNMSLGGGTFSTGSGVDETLGTLTVPTNSTITLGASAHSINFAASTSWAGTLTINGWTGSWNGTTGTGGKIYFGSNTSGLTSSTPSISMIRFYNGTTYFPGILLSTGECVPTTNTFYSKGSLTPSTASNWNTATDGSGTDAVAADFTGGSIFKVQSGHTMTTTASWSVSGTNSKIQVLSGGVLVAASGFPITAAAATTFQVDNGGTYKHQNTSAYATTILQGTTSLGTTSTFETNKTAATLPTLASYGNMIVNYTTDPGPTVYSTAITTCNGLTVTAAPTSFALTGANTFTGGVTLTSGTLLLGNASALGSGTFTINGGTINTTGGAVTSSTNNAQTWGGDFTFTGTNNLDLGTGAVALGATRSVTVSGSTLTVGGIISGATYGITKAGAGTLTLSGVNTYTGATTVNAGTLIAKTSASALGAGNLTLGGGTLQLSNTSGANLSFSRNTTVSTSSQITSDVNASGAGNTYTLGTLSIGNQTLTVAGGTYVTSGTAGVTFGAVTHTSTPTYTVNDPAGGGTTQLSLAAVANSTFLATMNGSGDIVQTGVYGNGSGGITYSGTGSLTLDQANTFSGTLTVSSGTVIGKTNAAALGAGSLTLSGGTLQLTNTSGTGVSFNRNTTVSNNSTITSDVLASGAGNTHTLGTLALGGFVLTVSKGSNVSSGTAGVTFGTTTVDATGNSELAVGTGCLVTLGAIGGEFGLIQSGAGTLLLATTSTRSTTGGTTGISNGKIRLNTANALNTNTAAVFTFATGSASTLSLGVDAGATYGGTAISVFNTSTIESDRITSGVGVTHTLTSLSIGNYTLSITAGSNVTSGTAGVTIGATTFSGTTTVLSVGASCNLTLGAISGTAKSFSKSGTGILTLGTAAGTRISGTTTLTAGTMILGNASALGTTGVTLTLSGGTLDLAIDATVNAYPTTVSAAATISSDRSTSGVGVTHTLGTLAINGSTLTMTAGSNVTSGTAGLTFGTTTLSASTATFDIGASCNLTLGAVGGAYVMAKQGAGTLTLGTTSTRTTVAGTTTLTAGTLRLEVANALNTSASDVLNLNGGTLSLGVTAGATYGGTAVVVGGNSTISSDRLTSGAGATQTVGTLSIGNNTLSVTAGSYVTSGTAQITTGAVTYTLTPTFTVTNSVGSTTQLCLPAVTGSTYLSTFNGDGNVIQTGIWSGSGGLTYSGTGTLTFSQANTYTGVTTISSGTVLLAASGVLADASTMSLGGGTFSSGSTTGYDETLGTLTMTATSTINVGTSNLHAIHYGDSHLTSWTGTLYVTNWTGSWNGTTGSGGQIFFGNSAAGLSAAQVSQIQFYDGATYYPAMILSTGEIVPTRNFYSKSSGASNLQTLSNWGTATDGTGCAPINFTSNNQVFYIKNTTAFTIGGAWTVSGTSSKVVLGSTSDAAINFTIPSASAFTGTIDLPAALSGSNTLTIQNTTIPTFGTINSASTINYNSSSNQTITSTTYGNLSVTASSGTPTKTLGGAITITGDLTIGSGATLDASSGNNYGISLAGNWSESGTFTPRNGTVTFTGSSSAINGSNTSETFYNLTLSKTAGQTLSTSGSITSVSISNAFTETTGNFTAPATMSITGTTTLTAGTFTAPSGTLTLSGDLTNNGTTFTHNSGTVTFTGSSSAINGTAVSVAFNNVAITKTAGQTLSTGVSTTSISVAGTFTETTGNFTAPATMSITGTTTLTAGTFTAPSGTLTLSGDLTNNGATFTHNSGTVTFTGSSSAINGTAASEAFNNLTITKTAGQTLSTGGSTTSITVAGTYTETTGNFTAPATMSITGTATLTAGTFTAPSGTLTLSGALTNNGGTFTHNSGTVTFTGNTSAINGTAASAAFNNVIITKTAGQTLSTGGSTTAITVAGTFTETTGNFTAPATMSVTGNTTLTSGTFTAPSGTLTLSGDYANNGATFTHNSGTVTMGGSTTQAIGGSSSTSFNNLTNSNTTAAVSVTVNTNVAGTLNMNGAGTILTPSAAVIFNTGGAAGIISGNGTVQVTRTAATADYSSQYKFSTNTLSSLTVEYNGGGAQTVSALTYGSLKINNASGATLAGNTTVNSTLTLSSGTLTVGANTLTLANNSAPVRTSGNIDATNTSAEVSFTNTSSITLPTSLFSGSISKFKMFGAGGVTLPENTTVSGTLTLSIGLLTVTGGTTLTLGTTSTNVTISGGGSSSYIVAYDSGTIGSVKSYVNSNASYSFPIGDASNYTPLGINLTSNGGLASAYLTVYTKPSKLSSLNSSFTTYLNRYWEFSQSGITSPVYNLTMTYVASDVHGTESALLPIKRSGTTWYKPSSSTFTNGTTQGTGSVDVPTHTLTWNTLTTFSTGTGVGTMAVGLPIELTYFKGSKDGNYNELKWETASEKNNDFFTVEKTSKDGSSFDVVGTMNGAGNSNKSINYSLTDYNVEKTINYYRLKQTDFDGKSTFTDLISIDNSEKVSTKEIIMITNILGQEVNDDYRGLVIIAYSDGSSEKIIR